MVKTLRTSHPASQSPQGIGARLVRRLGGAVRNALAGGLALAGALRRPSASQSGFGLPEARNAHARPAPERARTPCRARTAPPIPPSQPASAGQGAPCHGRRPPELSSRPLFPAGDVPFTPETVPGLGPELCAVLNTPLQDLDPKILRILLASLAQTIAPSMPPAAGMMDAHSIFLSLWSRLAGALDAAAPDAPLPALPDARSISPVEPAPDGLAVSPNPRMEAISPALPDALPDSIPESPPVPAEPQPAHAPQHVLLTTGVASERTPVTPSAREPDPRDRYPVLPRPISIRYSIGTVFRCAIRRFLCCGWFLRRCLPQRLPARRLCYPTRASPGRA